VTQNSNISLTPGNEDEVASLRKKNSQLKSPTPVLIDFSSKNVKLNYETVVEAFQENC
jgi:hypothetical protein